MTVDEDQMDLFSLSYCVLALQAEAVFLLEANA